MKKICPKCGAETEGNFCPDCGLNLMNIDEIVKTDEKSVAVETEGSNDGNTPNLPSSEAQQNQSFDSEREDESTEHLDTEITNNGEGIDEDRHEATKDEIEMVSEDAANVEEKGNKKKRGLILGGVIAAIVLIAIVAISSQPKLVSITAEYSGPTAKGTHIDGSSNIIVTGTYDNNSTKDVTGWSVDETTIVPGYNDIKVAYQDQTASISVYSPLMSGGQYVATVDEIKDVLYSNNYKYVEGFSGFLKDPENTGEYDYDGSALDLNVSFTKRSGSENVGVDGDEIPNAVIVLAVSSSDEFSDNIDRILAAGAAAFTTVDPVVNYDDAYSQIKECTSDAFGKAEGATATYEKSLDNLNIGIGMIVANNRLLLFYSFKSK